MMDKKTLKILNKMRKHVKKKIKKDNIRLDIKGVKERMEQNENKWENSKNIHEEEPNRCCVGCGDIIDSFFNRNTDEWHTYTPLCMYCYENREIWEATKYKLKRAQNPAEAIFYSNHLELKLAPMERSKENVRYLQLRSPQLLFLINLVRLRKLNLPIYKIDKEWADKNRTILLKDKEGEMYEDLKSILDYNEVMQELEKEVEELEIELNHITKVKEFVRRFVTEYMVTKRLIKNISIKAEKYIREFTAGQYGNLMMDLEGATKTGLAFKVKDHFNGVFESIEMISGGDRTSLGTALRLAISELMKVIRPTKDSPKKYPKIDFLLLDEPLAALDEVRRKRILSHLVKSKAFSQVFLITHTEIPPEIHTHRIRVSKNQSTGISTARFERQIPMIEDL